MAHKIVPTDKYAEIARMFRKEGVSQPVLGEMFGVSPSRISQLISLYESDLNDPDFPHGTKRGYELGCKCQPCRVARRKAGRRTRQLAGMFPVKRHWLDDNQ